MRLLTLLALPSVLASAVYAATNSAEYKEHLHLKPLPDGSLYAGFSFTATTPLPAYEKQLYRYFPRSLAQILQYTHTAELHLRFSLGRWDEESWGSRPRAGLREGGNGVELWAWLEDSAERSAEQRWSDLVNSLSGLFCASLNFIDMGKTVRPLLTFEPEGTLHALQTAQGNSTGGFGGSLQLLHGMLPHEVVCTENLTPFLKLLPCKGKAGISSLLDGHKLFDANWQTMSIDVRPLCPGPGSGECELEIQQAVDMVLDIERSQRPRDDPIPRPTPIEQTACDESKNYNGDDTCYPKRFEGEKSWTLSGIFGRSIKGSCPLAGSEEYDVTLEVPSARTVEVISGTSPTNKHDETARSYRLSEGGDFDLHLPQQNIAEHDLKFQGQSIYASRQMTGYGQERGGMHITLHNPRSRAQRIVYLESLPWFLRPYMHTLQISGGTMSNMYYTPLLDRERGSHLELLIDVPAQSSVQLTYDFEKAILRYTEYPPDANRGFDIPAAIIRVLHPNATAHEDAQGNYLRTTSLLLPLPTPDFSMPYNVIILTSTVIALGFGSIFNLLVRRFVLRAEVPPAPLAVIARNVIAKVRAMAAAVKDGKDMQREGRAEGVSQVTDGLDQVNGQARRQSKKDR